MSKRERERQFRVARAARARGWVKHRSADGAASWRDPAKWRALTDAEWAEFQATGQVCAGASPIRLEPLHSNLNLTPKVEKGLPTVPIAEFARRAGVTVRTIKNRHDADLAFPRRITEVGRMASRDAWEFEPVDVARYCEAGL
jgi:hypothetical protein